MLTPVKHGDVRHGWTHRLRVNWMYRRHSWRMTVYYNCLAILCCVGVTVTFVLHFLTAANSFFFVNYRCGSNTRKAVRANFVVMMMLAGANALVGLLTLRIIKLYISHTLSEFKPTGPWMARLGCLVKWLPWAMAFWTVIMALVSFSNIVFILAYPHGWCSRRWSPLALEAVKNCRLWYSGAAVCLTSAEHKELTNYLPKCNDGDYLKSTFFFYFIPKSEDATCSFSQPEICLLYKNSYSTLAVEGVPDWTKGQPAECEGLNSKDKPPEDFMAAGNSDIYKYFLIYAVAWSAMMICALFLFFYIKWTSHFEGYFSQPPSKTKHVLFLPFSYFAPWSQ